MAHFQEKLFDEYDEDEQDYETHLATYVEELSAKRYDTALESCDGMLEASPKDAEAALCRALVHALRGDDDEEDDDYCTLWLKRCDRWRVDGEDCMGVPWGERAQRDFPPARLKERPAWQKAILDLDKPADCGDAEVARRFLARCARRRDAAPTPPPPPVIEITEAASGSTAAQSVLDHVVDHGEFPEEMVDERPLVTVSQGLDEETFETLKAALVNHPRLQNADSEALGESFRGSSGFVVRFDGWGGVDATAKKLWVRSETRPLVPFFRRCADKECTGFVLNVLVVAPSEDDDEVVVDENAPEAVKLLLRKKAAESIDEQYAVGWHRDATLGLKPGADAAPPLAHRVSVLYVAVPEATGGELCLRNADRPPWRSERGVIDREVAPKQNRLAVFRGDAEHAVRRVTNVTKADAAFPKGHRVSLVLEQYRVPPGLREFTMHFEIVEGKDYERVND